MSRVKITSANIDYPNGRYQEVPPIKPPNQKMLISFFTQGVPRVQDQQTKIEIKKIYILTFGMGESTAFIRCQANSGQGLSYYWENPCGDRNDGGLSGEFSCSPRLSQISPIIGNINSKETSPCPCPSSAAVYLSAPEKSQHHSGLLVRLCLLGLDLWTQATLLTRGWGEPWEAGH